MDHAAIATNLSTKVNRAISGFRTKANRSTPFPFHGCCVSLFRTYMPTDLLTDG